MPEVYLNNPPTSSADLCSFPLAVVILVMAWLVALLVISWWEKAHPPRRDRAHTRGRLPVVFLVLSALLCSCTSRTGLPGGSYGTWSTGPDDEQASVTIWRTGEAWLRIGQDVLPLRK